MPFHYAYLIAPTMVAAVLLAFTTRPKKNCKIGWFQIVRCLAPIPLCIGAWCFIPLYFYDVLGPDISLIEALLISFLPTWSGLGFGLAALVKLGERAAKRLEKETANKRK